MKLFFIIILCYYFNPLKIYEHSQKPKYLYVTAKSGLNFRIKPKGKVLGKFPLNTLVKVIFKTSVKDTIQDEREIITGTWVGVAHKKDTVYVFDGFLSEDKVLSDIKLYYVSASYTSKKGDLKTGFVNISDCFFKYQFDTNGNIVKKPILAIDNYSKDTILLNQKERLKFLKRTNIKESDSLFIYNFNGNVTTFLVKNLQVIACINTYFSPLEYNREEADYELGFEMGNNFKSGSGLVFVGNKNPFSKNELKKMIWKKTNPKSLPKFIFKEIVRSNLLGLNLQICYVFLYSNLEFYLLDYQQGNVSDFRFLVVYDQEKQQILYSEIQRETESISFNPINTIDSNINYGNQFVGKLFKNKAPVFFGFYNHSFGCPSITVLDKTEPKVPILCDNRH